MVDVTKLATSLVTSAYISTSEARGSTSYGALTTPVAVTVTVPASGRVKMSWGCDMNSATTNISGYMSIVLSGANTVAAGSYLTRQVIAATGSDISMSAYSSIVITGMTPGSTTFTAQHKGSSSNSINYSLRSLIVELLP